MRIMGFTIDIMRYTFRQSNIAMGHRPFSSMIFPLKELYLQEVSQLAMFHYQCVYIIINYWTIGRNLGI